jgi:hypothetical protein
MQTKELPFRPSLEQYKKQAKDLLKGHKSGDLQALQRVKNNHPRLGKVADAELQTARLILADAQLVIAREHGFESWPNFAKHIDALGRASSPVSKFEAAVDAIVGGDIAELNRLLRETPELARERSTRKHRATLLHYVGANGVEDFRQKTAKNIVEVAEILLKAGAEVDAVGQLYGGTTALGLAATSVHPALAGVQEALIDILLAYGASFEVAVARNYTSGLVINACLANGRGRAAEHLAMRGAVSDMEGAAGVGRLEAVKAFFTEDGALKPGTTNKQMEAGFMWACQYGRTKVVEFLLEKGLRVDAAPHGETGLHWAAYNAHVDILRLLLARTSPVNVKDRKFDGTPLGWCLYGWCEPSLEAEPDHYCEVVALLIAAGAVVDWEWLNDPFRGRRIKEKIDGDPRMVAALRN